MKKRSIVAKKSAGLMLGAMMLMSSVGTLGSVHAEENSSEQPQTYIKSLRFYGSTMDEGRDGVKGYTVIPYDLNKGKFWGDTIYLAYQTTTDPDEAITNIMTKASPNDDLSPDPGYVDIDFYTLLEDGWLTSYDCFRDKIDLNRNAGGDYIYMYYTKDKSAGAPITSITIDGNSENAITCDLNQGTNGDHMWAHVTREEINVAEAVEEAKKSAEEEAKKAKDAKIVEENRKAEKAAAEEAAKQAAIEEAKKSADVEAQKAKDSKIIEENRKAEKAAAEEAAKKAEEEAAKKAKEEAEKKAAEEAAKKARFNSVSGSNNQTGTITYYFKLK